MTDGEWAAVCDQLPAPAWMNGKGGKPEGYCHRQVIDAIRYLVDNGIKWRVMPADFPVWDRVYAFWRRWRETGLIAEFHDRLRGKVRESEGRDVEPTAAIIDSQSVRAAASVPAASRGLDGGKKINGRKRHIIVDCLGLLLMVLVTAADVTDRDAACGMLERLRVRYRRIRLVWVDGGCTGRLVDWAKETLRLTLEIVKRSDDTAGFVVLPRRWVVERTLSWLMRSRRLARDYETRPQYREAAVLWSMTMFMGHRLARHRTRNVPGHPPRREHPGMRLGRPAPLYQSLHLRPHPLDLRRNHLQTQPPGQLPRPQPGPARLRLRIVPN
ncbi:IS5 family transposase [Streptomyces sp. NPDC060048]|uniref:IS5 family transposase n=1 Tax=unclassified Streptomyces TaxID=2593676 RepID=UPI0036951929